jgi:hypothetical protein
MAATLFTDHFDNQDTSKNDSLYTKTGLVFGFSRNQSLVAVIPGQKAPRTLLISK